MKHFMTYRLSFLSKVILLVCVLIAWLSGIAFFVLDQWFKVDGEFGLTNHPAQHLFLYIHGGISFILMIVYGYFIGTHVIPAFKYQQHRRLGYMVTSCIGFLSLTGYLLYYLSNKWMRNVVIYSHIGIGFILPLVMVGHMITSKNYLNRRLK